MDGPLRLIVGLSRLRPAGVRAEAESVWYQSERTVALCTCSGLCCSAGWEGVPSGTAWEVEQQGTWQAGGSAGTRMYFTRRNAQEPHWRAQEGPWQQRPRKAMHSHPCGEGGTCVGARAHGHAWERATGGPGHAGRGVLQGDPEKGHNTDTFNKCWIPGLRILDTQGPCREHASHTYSPQSEMITFSFGFPSLLPWAFVGRTEKRTRREGED